MKDMQSISLVVIASAIMIKIIWDFLKRPQVVDDERRKGMAEVISELRRMEIKMIEGFADIKTELAQKIDRREFEELKDELRGHAKTD